MDYLVLVNKTNKCPDLDIKLVDTKSRYANNRYSEEKTFKAFKKLQKFAKERGYDIEIESAYRSIEYQQKIYDKCVENKGLEHTKKYVATPGYSEHHTGLALDICLVKDDIFIIEHDLPVYFIDFLSDNAYKFGFIIRYPHDKEAITGYNYEPWHIRYVGVNNAKTMKNNNITLEEYLCK